jgi:hypothetical protein
MEQESLWGMKQFLMYGGILLAILVGIVGPMFLLRTKHRQGPPRGPRHTDTDPADAKRQH